MAKPAPTHSPVPWRTNRDRTSIHAGPGDDNASLIAAVRFMGGDNSEGRSNAAHIVACVNVHDELADLVARALPYMEEAERDPAYKPNAVAPLVKRMRAAIAKL